MELVYGKASESRVRSAAPEGACMKPASLGALAQFSAVLTAACGLLYAVTFVVLRTQVWFSLFLTLGGLLSIVVFVELYQRLQTGVALPLLALLLGLLGAAGAMAHGGYDLATALHQVPSAPGAADLPSAADPRGLAAFGLTGLAMLTWSVSIFRSADLGRGLGSLGVVSGVLLLLIYLARLIVLDAANPAVLLPALLEGFLVNPVWYLWLAWRL